MIHVRQVVYRVTFDCVVEWDDDEDEQDAISNIDIPEGGVNDSVYRESSLEILSVDNPEEG